MQMVRAITTYSASALIRSQDPVRESLAILGFHWFSFVFLWLLFVVLGF